MINNVLIVVSEFNRSITTNLARGAIATLRKHGLEAEQIDLVWVPGAFELPLLAAKAAKYGRYQGIICLGCVIRGETPHFDYVCNEAARGIMEVSLKAELPVIFGVLTVDTMAQAEARSRLEAEHPAYAADSMSKRVISNKGAEAAAAVINMIHLMHTHPARWTKDFPHEG